MRKIMAAILSLSFLTPYPAFSGMSEANLCCIRVGGVFLSLVLFGGTAICAGVAGASQRPGCDPSSDFNISQTETTCQKNKYGSGSTCSVAYYCDSANGTRTQAENIRDWPLTKNLVIATSVLASATLVSIGLTAVAFGAGPARNDGL